MGKFKKTHMPNVNNCDSIFIPVNDLCCHWYMLLIKCHTGVVEVWDSLPPNKGLDTQWLDQVRKLMTSFDIVVAEDIAAAFIQEFSFVALPIKLNESAPRQPNDYDSRLFLCMFIRQSYPSTAEMKKFNSQVTRLLLVSFLSTCLETKRLQ
ncbi:hypothetical protein ACOSQ3_029007 [Xanthoceras sorbifolium]